VTETPKSAEETIAAIRHEVQLALGDVALIRQSIRVVLDPAIVRRVEDRLYTALRLANDHEHRRTSGLRCIPVNESEDPS
jgi:hypothetical protein